MTLKKNRKSKIETNDIAKPSTKHNHKRNHNWQGKHEPSQRQSWRCSVFQNQQSIQLKLLQQRPLKSPTYGEMQSLSRLLRLSQPIHRSLRRKHIPHIEIVHQHPFRRLLIQTLTKPHLCADTSRSCGRICLRVVRAIGYVDTEDGDVKEVIDDVHAASGRGVGGAVEGTFGEFGVEGVVGGFEEVGEFVEDVGDGRVGARI